ncbi:TMV resistance protein N [Spatholobus suberectus]|nr:TMV resistance protein N [Spatholobus suberectus]
MFSSSPHPGFLLPKFNEYRESLMVNRIHEVFLSFRGEDTRFSFTSHLYAALQNAGIIVFKDDQSLRWGHHVSPSLLQAIEYSKISVVVFSTNYAESRWCLAELNKIMECHRTIGQVVVPVFYDVDPSEVRHQTGHFGKAFQNLENRISTEKDQEAPHLKKQLRELGMSESEIEDTLTSYLTGTADVLSWREALREAAGISGVVVLNSR